MTKLLKFPAGTALQFTNGEYSDFGPCGAVILLRDCDLIALGKAFVKEHGIGPEIFAQTKLEGSDFVSWLIVNEYAFPAAIQEIWLGRHFDLHERDNA